MPEDLPPTQQCIYRQLQHGIKNRGDLYDACCPNYPQLNTHLNALINKGLIEADFATPEGSNFAVLIYKLKSQQRSWFMQNYP